MMTGMKTLFLAISFVIGCLLTATVKHETTSEVATMLVSPNLTVASNGVEKSSFGKTKEGAEVSLFTCRNAGGSTLKLIDYGATVVALEVPDRTGKLGNVLLSCPDLAGFEACTMYFNCSVGRYCNRIAQGKFTLDGQTYNLATNNAPNHLHGGAKGFDKRMWQAEPFQSTGAVGVSFKYESPDGEEGYPGKLIAKVTYTLTDKNEFIIEFRASTDKATPVNLTNHNYWNLSGSGTIRDHELKLAASRYLPVDATAIPTGEMAAVAGTPFDFAEFTPIGKRLKDVGGDPIGYDHCYVIDGEAGRLRLAAVVRDPASGRKMEIQTTEPGIQFYSGNFLDGTPISGKYPQYSGFCLETQHFPDSPNRPEWPSTILKPGEQYFHKTVHTFSAE
ncbi:MAG: aldose epimerase family protein [Planctomycetota bacterium]